MSDLDPPPNDPDRDLSRRSRSSSTGPIAIVMLIVLAGAAIYVALALWG